MASTTSETWACGCNHYEPERTFAHTIAFVADLMKKVEDSLD